MKDDPTIALSIKVPLSLYNKLSEHIVENDTKMTPFVRELIRRALYDAAVKQKRVSMA